MSSISGHKWSQKWSHKWPQNSANKLMEKPKKFFFKCLGGKCSPAKYTKVAGDAKEWEGTLSG